MPTATLVWHNSHTRPCRRNQQPLRTILVDLLGLEFGTITRQSQYLHTHDWTHNLHQAKRRHRLADQGCSQGSTLNRPAKVQYEDKTSKAFTQALYDLSFRMNFVQHLDSNWQKGTSTRVQVVNHGIESIIVIIYVAEQRGNTFHS